MTQDLSKLSIEELRKLKETWFEEAFRAGKFSILSKIADSLGKQVASRYTKHEYEGEGFVIYNDNYGGYVWATFNGKKVADSHGCERLWVKGDWENQMMILGQRADKKIMDAENERKEKERKELVEKLTL